MPCGKGNALCGLLGGWHTLPCDNKRNASKEMNDLPCCRDNTPGGRGTLPSDSVACSVMVVMQLVASSSDVTGAILACPIAVHSVIGELASVTFLQT